MSTVAYLSFWGKARPAEGGGPTWHPVAYHLLDVAASLEALLAARPVTRGRAARLLGVGEKEASSLLVAMAGMHDLGKFARPFQSRCPDLWPASLGVLNAASVPLRNHTEDGWLLWDLFLRDRLSPDPWPVPASVDVPLLRAVFGHHGKPLRDEVGQQPEWVFGSGGLQAAESCAREILRLFGPSSGSTSDFEEEQSRVASWWVAGLISLADWIGSNQRWFPYRNPDLAVEEYWRIARDQAQGAVVSSGLAAPRASAVRSFDGLTGKGSPTPMQIWAEQAEFPSGPLLFILEDVTGSGKTEAAQMLVHRLMASGRVSGAYWGMPTQATANAMYGRQAGMLVKLFTGRAKACLVLAHGQAKLHLGFQKTIIHDIAAERMYREEEDLTSSAACAAFLAADRRAAMLADVGAGTVDQALLAILPSRFNTVRLMGLADKVLVLDEAHAYDEYMGVEARALLRFQAAMGGSAIVLSATLPESQRRQLIEAWRAGADPHQRPSAGLWGEPEAVTSQSQAYPLATVVSAAASVETPVSAAAERRVPVRLVGSTADAVAVIVRAQRQGAAVAWIRNTVDDCLAAAALLRTEGLEPLVFHARFAQGDRQAREREVLHLFGPDSKAPERQGRVIVASQVIEQSLDLDFDVLVTDIAPMDLIIQRAGRLRRHHNRDPERPSGLACELLVLSPAPVDDPDSSWLAGEFRGTSYVYNNPGVLWITAKLLERHREIRSPGEIRALVEAAYDPGAVPAGLESGSDKAFAIGNVGAAMARYSTLTLDEGYHGFSRTWESDTRVLTRLADPQSIIRLARLEGDSLLPWAEGEDSEHAWALSEVKVRAWRAPLGSVTEARFCRAAIAVQQSWGKYEQEIPVLPLLPDGAEWAGTLVRPDGKLAHFHYSAHEGLSWPRGATSGDGPEETDVTPHP